VLTSLLAFHFLTLEASAEEGPEVPSGWTMVLPLGAPQFLMDRKPQGFVFGGIQVLGIGGAVYTGLEMVRLAEEGEVDQELRMRTLSAFSVGMAGGAWLASVIDGSHARDVAIEKAQSARNWERQQRVFAFLPMLIPRP
jgi:hypothetical protein